MPIISPSDVITTIPLSMDLVTLTCTGDLPTGFQTGLDKLILDEVGMLSYIGSCRFKFDSEINSCTAFQMLYPANTIDGGWNQEPLADDPAVDTSVLVCTGSATLIESDGLTHVDVNVSLKKRKYLVEASVVTDYYFEFELPTPVTFQTVVIECNYENINGL